MGVLLTAPRLSSKAQREARTGTSLELCRAARAPKQPSAPPSREALKWRTKPDTPNKIETSREINSRERPPPNRLTSHSCETMTATKSAGREFGKPAGIVVGPAVFDGHIASLHRPLRSLPCERQLPPGCKTLARSRVGIRLRGIRSAARAPRAARLQLRCCREGQQIPAAS